MTSIGQTVLKSTIILVMIAVYYELANLDKTSCHTSEYSTFVKYLAQIQRQMIIYQGSVLVMPVCFSRGNSPIIRYFMHVSGSDISVTDVIYTQSFKLLY